MNLRTLQYLVAIADTGHFGHAAKKCFVSQPTLSMQVKKFEDQHNVQLFERNNKTVMLTDVGRHMVEQARKVITAASELKDIALTAQNPSAGSLKVGIIPTLAPYLLPKIIPPLREQLPELTLYLIEQQTEKILEKLQQGEMDIALLALPINHQTLSKKALFDEAFYLAAPNTHALAKKKQIKQSDFSDQAIMLLEEGHCLRDQALEVCQLNSDFQVHDFQATSLETLRQMVSSGVGVTLMPELAVQPSDPDITYIPFSTPQPTRKIALVWRKTSIREPLFNKIGELIQAVIGDE